MVDVSKREIKNLREEVRRLHARISKLGAVSAQVALSLDLGIVLRSVVDSARDLTGARYGALGVFDGEDSVQEFVTSGISQEERDRIGDLPKGMGILGLLHEQEKPIRLPDLSRDRRSVGFPPGHPAMKTFLGATIQYQDRALGHLYLTEKENMEEFTAEDEQILVLFASQAAVAINNAHQHAEIKDLAVVRERERIAREMHDGMAQVLGYINSQTLVIKKLLSRDEPVTALGEIDKLDYAARALYVDVREGILGLRTMPAQNQEIVTILREYLEQHRSLSGLSVTMDVSPEADDLKLPTVEEVQLIRIVQEALSNVRKHSEATMGRVAIRVDNDDLSIDIVDNGRGFDPERRGRKGYPTFGLQTMRERAESIGGVFETESSPGRGTRVTVRIPASSRAGKI